MAIIHLFSGKYHFLSNFCPSPTPYMGITWKSAEHAYQAAKLTDDNVARAILRDMPSPGLAKRYARKHPKPDGWDDRKVQVMREVLWAKFTHVEFRKQQLLETGDAHLLEGNDWGDEFWGCVKAGHVWRGENTLGKLLMELREKLRG